MQVGCEVECITSEHAQASGIGAEVSWEMLV
jgi:hypothetical protein